MATARPAKNSATPRATGAARKKAATAPRRKAAPAGPAAADAAGAQGLLRAGLKALGSMRDDVVKRQTHVLESLLGMRRAEDGGAPSTLAHLDPFGGLRKFEDVFDQRVAAALERLGLPSAARWQALQEEVVALRAELARLQPAADAPAPSGRKPRRRSAR